MVIATVSTDITYAMAYLIALTAGMNLIVVSVNNIIIINSQMQACA